MSLAAAGLAAGGIIGGGLISASSQQQTNQQMMDFAREMSSTQYQRAVEDMRAAGINPVMAAGNGGASAPTSQLSAPGAAAGNGLANAAKTLAIEIPTAQANIDQQKANTAVAKQVEKRTEDERKLTQANARLTQANARAVESQQPERDVRAKPWQAGKEWIEQPANTPAAKNANWIHQKEGRQKQAPTKATESGKGTVYGGPNSARAMGNTGAQRNNW